MKTKRRFWGVLLAVCMALTFVPTTAFAAANGAECDGGPACVHEAAVGSIHYDTLNDAISAAAGQEIQLLKSVTVNEPIIITQDTVINGANGSDVFQVTPSPDSSSTERRMGLFHMNSETDAPVILTLKNIELINKNENGKWSDACGISVQASNQTVNLDNVMIDTSHYCLYVGVPREEEEEVNDVTINIDHSNLTGYAAVYYRTNSITNMIMRPVLNVTDSVLTGRGYNGYGNGFSTIVYNGTRDARAVITGCTLSNSFNAANANADEGVIQFNCYGAYEEGAEITISYSTIKTRSTTAAPNVIKYTAGENLNVGNKVIVDDLTIMVDENEKDLIRLMRNENELVATGKTLNQVLSVSVPNYGDKPGVDSPNTGTTSLLTGGDVVLVPIDTSLTSDVTIPENVTIIVSEGAKLTIPEGVKLDGAAGAKLVIHGTVEGLDGITGSGSYTWQNDSWMVSATGVTLNAETLTLQKDDTVQLVAAVQPENATNKAVTWKSSDENVAVVDADGKVTAVSCGTAMITVMVDGTDLTDSCSVKVDHIPMTTGKKSATCTSEGYTGNKVCKICSEVIEKGQVVAKTAHDFKDGKCTVCGVDDPNYKPTVEPTKPEKPDTDIPQTGDNSNMALWFSLMGVSFVGLGTAFFLRKRRESKAG